MTSKKFDIGKMIVAGIERKFYLLSIWDKNKYIIIIYVIPELHWR